MEAGQAEGMICYSALEAELQGLLLSMHQAWIRGYRQLIFEGDNKIVKSLIDGSLDLHKTLNYIIGSGISRNGNRSLNQQKYFGLPEKTISLQTL